MTHHHRRRRRARTVFVTLAVVAVLAVTTFAVIRSQAARCSGQLNLAVTVAPDIAATVTTAADDFNNTNPSADGNCVHVTVSPENSAEVAGELPTEQINPPAIWIPDSSLWADQVIAQASTLGAFAPKLTVGGSLATSPLVLAAPSSYAQTLGYPATKPSWRALAGGALPAMIGNPTTTTEGLTSILMIESVVGAPMSAPSAPLAGLLLQLGRSATSDIAAQFTSDTGGKPHVFTTTEQAVTQTNRNGGTQFVPMMPQEGTFLFDYPVVTVQSRSESPGTAAATSAFENALRSSQTATLVAGAGFRSGDADTSGFRGYPPTATVSTLLKTWVAVNLDARFLTVVDVSGSMNELSPNGETKAEIVRDATNVGLSEFPDSSEIGLWDFSSQLAPPNDWQELVPVGPLGEMVGSVTRRAALQQADSELPSVVHGGTALYSTALAAYQDVLAGYDSTKIDAVVLMTDGSNDTDHGPDLATTVAQLRAMANPARPLPLLAIGIGPAADMGALGQLAAATGGKAYRVDTAADIVSVFLDALVRRTCESGCG